MSIKPGVSKEEARKRLMTLISIKTKEKKIEDNMKKIRYKIGVISGKGGVGKSTVTAYLSLGLAQKKFKVGIIDSDFHGPSIPKILGIEDKKIRMKDDKTILPVKSKEGIKVISIHYFLRDPTSAVIWRGPLKKSFLEDILAYTDFGEIDFLFFDLPPGCLPSNTEIYKYPFGKTQLSSLKPGDYIYSFQGRITQLNGEINIESKLSLSKILDLIPQGQNDIYEIRTKYRSIKGTPNHPILTLHKQKGYNDEAHNYELSWVPISRLREGDQIVVMKREPTKMLDIGIEGKPLNDKHLLKQLKKTDEQYFGIEGIEEIRYVGKDEVYDIMTNNRHNFIANGVVVHNTGDEALNLIQTVPGLTGLIAVTQPTDVSALTVAKAIDFTVKSRVKLIGIIENMSGFVCPGENKLYKIFHGEGGKILSEKYKVSLLGKLPIDPRLSEAADKGINILEEDPDALFTRKMKEIVERVINEIKA